MRVSLINTHVMESDAIGQCLANQARVLEARGDDVRVFVQFLPPDAPQSVLSVTRVVNLAEIRSDPHFIQSDLYVFHYPGLYSLLDSIPDLPREKVVFYYHNVTPPDLWGFEHERELLERSQAAVQALVALSGLVVTPSPFNAEQLVSLDRADLKRIRVLPMGVDLTRFGPGVPNPELAAAHGLAGRRIILFVGRMAGNKRMDLLVEALPLVQQEVPDAALLLVGDNSSNPTFVEYVARIKTRAEALGIANSVVFAGKVEDLVPYYHLAEVYATASLHEGFGVPIIEAMASGVPVVASRATAHPWVVGEAGMLADADSVEDMAAAIVRVLRDDVLRGDLTRKGETRARELSTQQYDVNWDSILNELQTSMSAPTKC